MMEPCDLKNESHQYQTSFQYGLTKFKTTHVFYEQRIVDLSLF